MAAEPVNVAVSAVQRCPEGLENSSIAIGLQCPRKAESYLPVSAKDSDHGSNWDKHGGETEGSHSGMLSSSIFHLGHLRKMLLTCWLDPPPISNNLIKKFPLRISQVFAF